MEYEFNKISNINGNNIVLLLDNYFDKSKRQGFFESFTVDEKNSFYINNAALENTHKQHPNNSCFGIWQLLLVSKQINLDNNEKLILVYSNEQQTQGIYLYYNYENTQYNSGLIIAGNLLGFVGSSSIEKEIIQIDYNLLVEDLSSEVLRPLDRYRKKQHFIKKVASYAVISALIVFITLLLLANTIKPMVKNSTFFYSSKLHNNIERSRTDLRNKQAELLKLENTRLHSKIDNTRPIILTPLIQLANIDSNIKLETQVNVSNIVMTFSKLQPWMSQLTDDFIISKNNKKIKITWDAK